VGDQGFPISHVGVMIESMTPGLFRVGASSLLDDLFLHVREERSASCQGTGYPTSD
jgi:hypothetical protein